MTPAARAARDAAVAALVAAEWISLSRQINTYGGRLVVVYQVIGDVLDAGNVRRASDLAALHALALLLAALTAPAPATCAPGCVRLVTEGPGHPGACSVPETGGGR